MSHHTISWDGWQSRIWFKTRLVLGRILFYGSPKTKHRPTLKLLNICRRSIPKCVLGHRDPDPLVMLCYLWLFVICLSRVEVLPPWIHRKLIRNWRTARIQPISIEQRVTSQHETCARLAEIGGIWFRFLLSSLKTCFAHADNQRYIWTIFPVYSFVFRFYV